jgi:hypothetical protein
VLGIATTLRKCVAVYFALDQYHPKRGWGDVCDALCCGTIR